MKLECFQTTMAGKELKDSLDAVVEKVVKKLDKKTFLECLPQEADQALLNSLHDRFVTVVRRKMMENVEEHMAERQVLAKLEELRVKKRAEREEREKEEAKAKEKSRREGGNDVGKIRQALAEQEIKKLAELRRREKEETKVAKARVKGQGGPCQDRGGQGGAQGGEGGEAG